MRSSLTEESEPQPDAEPTASRRVPPRRLASTPDRRRLQVFAFDPLLSTRIDTLGVNQITVPVPWEESLAPGPVGEYLEVVDHDPAGGCYYEPVDLNDPRLLATDGLAPSEGNPQFHQQMVYAVAMTTIRHFEQALGRRALWSPRQPSEMDRSGGQEEYVQRLRIYPHALREANAYYSPVKRALLFGYFPASSSVPGRNLPGGTVFTCLSHDIVAHETTHALLDGMHHRFIEPSNPDVLALHEAFADVVALMQHFSFPGVLRHQIAQTRGDLSSQSLLGQLARQFGEAVGRYGALRDAIGTIDPETKAWKPAQPDPVAYQTTFEPHARGSILVAAVFDAFLAIYSARVADLLRIATAGSGVLPPGDLHPDLVSRLAGEAAKSAQHVLTMCIRALDYCPPVDLTFGEYLRAIVTADTELVRDDDRGYRIAMIEAFRRRGLYPEGVRSLAPDSLLWRGVDEEPDAPDRDPPLGVPERSPVLGANSWNLSAGRERMFRYARKLRIELHSWLGRLRESGDPAALSALTGLALGDDAPASILRDGEGRPRFEVHAVYPARKVGPDGQLALNLVVELTQRRKGFVDADRQARVDRGLGVAVKEDFTFRGGCTLVFDLETATPRYVIRKSILSEARLRRRREYLATSQGGSLRATYFGPNDGNEPFAMLHRDA
jgi:hypothetical protein